MNLGLEARTLLEEVGYCTEAQHGTVDSFYFEDENVLGMVCIYASVDDLLSGWEESQDRFLRGYALQLRENPEKAWNIYSVHLCADSGTEAELDQLRDAEEDFRAARKIARDSVRTRSELKVALLPLLPFQQMTLLEKQDSVSRLRERLVVAGPFLSRLMEDVPVEEVVRELLEER